MKMLHKLKSRQADMKTLAKVMEASLATAADKGEQVAGAHHLALAALAMPDGIAESVFEQLGTSGEAFSNALDNLDATALSELGIEVAGLELDPGSVPRERLGKTDATYEAALKATHDLHNRHGDYRPLNGAHLLAGVATVGVGVSARAFAAMGLDRSDLIAACEGADDQHAER